MDYVFDNELSFKRNLPKRRSLASNFEFSNPSESKSEKSKKSDLRKMAVSQINLNMTTIPRSNPKISKSKLIKEKCVQLGKKILSFKKRKNSKILKTTEHEITADIVIWEEDFEATNPIPALLAVV